MSPNSISESTVVVVALFCPFATIFWKVGDVHARLTLTITMGVTEMIILRSVSRFALESASVSVSSSMLHWSRFCVKYSRHRLRFNGWLVKSCMKWCLLFWASCFRWSTVISVKRYCGSCGTVGSLMLFVLINLQSAHLQGTLVNAGGTGSAFSGCLFAVIYMDLCFFENNEYLSVNFKGILSMFKVSYGKLR